MLRARPVGVFGVDGRQRDERAAVTRPAGHPRQPGERNLTGQHGAGADAPRQHREGVVGRPPIPPRPLHGRRRIDLELHEPLHAVERVGEDPLDPPLRAVEVDEHRKRGAPRLREQDGRSACSEQPPLNLGDLEMGIDGMVDFDEQPFGPERRDTALQ